MCVCKSVREKERDSVCVCVCVCVCARAGVHVCVLCIRAHRMILPDKILCRLNILSASIKNQVTKLTPRAHK